MVADTSGDVSGLITRDKYRERKVRIYRHPEARKVQAF